MFQKHLVSEGSTGNLQMGRPVWVSGTKHRTGHTDLVDPPGTSFHCANRDNFALCTVKSPCATFCLPLLPWVQPGNMP